MPWGQGVGGRKCDYPRGTSDKRGLRQRVGLHTASLDPPPAASLHLHMVRTRLHTRMPGHHTHGRH